MPPSVHARIQGAACLRSVVCVSDTQSKDNVSRTAIVVRQRPVVTEASGKQRVQDICARIRCANVMTVSQG